MQSEQPVNNDETAYATYETLSAAQRIPVATTGFVEIVHMRAHLKNGTTRDFIRISRGYVTKTGGSRTERFVTVPASIAGDLANLLAIGGADVATPQARLQEVGA